MIHVNDNDNNNRRRRSVHLVGQGEALQTRIGHQSGHRLVNIPTHLIILSPVLYQSQHLYLIHGHRGDHQLLELLPSLMFLLKMLLYLWVNLLRE